MLIKWQQIFLHLPDWIKMLIIIGLAVAMMTLVSMILVILDNYLARL